MGKKYEKDEEKIRAKFCAMQLKMLLTTLMFLCFLSIFIQILPTCLLIKFSNPSNRSFAEVVENRLVIKRSFNPIGTGAYNFILMSAYRAGSNTFAIMGLASKPLHVFGRPIYTCAYNSNNIDAPLVETAEGETIIPDYGFGRVYTTVVITCIFSNKSTAVAESAVGGELILHASVNGGFDTRVKTTDTILALTEPPNSWTISQFAISSIKYDYLYCGSPLYGEVSPQRVREWLAYHVRLFGERAHFIIYDAGGVHPEVLEVLTPWIELGFVTLHDIREQERFDAYYHNQFIVLNDCLHRYRFKAKWIFFFDVDEYIYVNDGIDSFGNVMESLEEFSQFTIEQMPMSDKLCFNDNAANTTEKWGFEKLVYRNAKGKLMNRKYAVQARNVFAAGVHMTFKFMGNTSHKVAHLIKYFHYHNTLSHRREPCRLLVKKTRVKVDGARYVRDLSMNTFAPLVKSFELSKIGTRLESTAQ